MQTILNYEAAKAVLAGIANYLDADFDQLGISPIDFKLTYDPVIWRTEQRLRVVRTLEALLYGTTSMLGLSRLQLPAEYIAAIVATFVAPCNRKLACIYLADIGTGRRAEDLAQGVSTEQVSPEQLFALVFLLSQNDAGTQARQQFAQRLGLAVAASVKA